MPEAPSGNRNLFKNSRDFSSGWINNGGSIYTEDYQDVKIFKKQELWGGRSQYFEVKAGEEYVFSAYVKSSAEADRVTFYLVHTSKQPVATGLVSFDSAVGQDAVSFDLTDEYQRIAIKIKITKDGWIMPRLERFNNDAYLFYGGYKLEKGETATPYSQAPEDLGWSMATLVPTQQQRYLWKFEYIYYSDGSVEVTDPVNLSIAGADADTTGVTDAINQTNQTVASLQSSVSQAQSDLATVSSNLTQARQNLESSIASVNTKAQAVETTLAQVQSTANANSQKTATLENNLDGLNARFSSLQVGGTNLLLYSADPWQAPDNYYENAGAVRTDETLNGSIVYKTRAAWSSLRMNFGKHLIDRKNVKVGDEFTYSVYVRTDQETPIEAMLFFRYSGGSGQGMTGGKVINQEWQRFTKTFTVSEKMLSDSSKLSWVGFEQTSDSEDGKYVYYACNKLERGNIATDYSPNEADLELKVADYKQTADQNYASLQSTVQALDGTVTANKATADQTAQGFSTRIESLETYKNGETTRANQYFESAKTETARQLTAERTAIANDYVAKSTYTSDVTGIRNDLTATTTTANTTKTNLANYQASNDQAVASLQSSLQTTDGNVSNLQTQINAVPGQITSAVSAVEGKIPTFVGGTNLLLYSTDPWEAPNDYYENAGAARTDETLNGSIVYKTRAAWSSLRMNFGKHLIDRKNVKVGDEFTYSVYVRTDQETPIKATLFFRYSDQSGQGMTGGKVINQEWQRFTKTFTVSEKMLSDSSKLSWVGFEQTSDSEDGKYVYYACNKLERGSLPTDWSPTPEDTATQISNLSSQIQQTAGGMTLLATKTELNSAKTELQSGITTATSKADSAQATANSNAQTISTHTTQISALNTGLQAKVSQSDFDSLSGRVTTAESNLTATANQLSSQISSVNERIPTKIGSVNLIKQSTAQKGLRLAMGAEPYADQTHALTDWIKVEPSTTYTLTTYEDVDVANMYYSLAFYSTNADDYSGWISRPTGAATAADLKNGRQYTSPANAAYAKVSYPINYSKVKLERGNITTDYSPAPEDYDAALTQAKSEIKQTTDAITASVSSVQTAASNAQSTANTAVSKADAAQAGVNTLDSTTVKTASLNLDNNGFVTKVGKTIDGNKFATMIAQDANNVKIIADEMQVTANMIVDGAVTANKLNVNSLSAVNSNLGAIKGGSLLLQENKLAGSATDNWGTYNRPAYKQGLFLDNHAFASSGAIQRKNGNETTPTDMPLAVLQAGELRFLVVDYNDNLENVVHYGLSDPDFGAIRFEIDSELKRRLTMTSSGYLNFQASNYTNWTSTGVSGCEYMIQGRLVLVNYDVTFNSAGTHTIGGIPQEFTKKSLMMTAKAWTITPRDKNIQLNSDGTLHILDAEANVNYRGTLVFSY